MVFAKTLNVRRRLGRYNVKRSGGDVKGGGYNLKCGARSAPPENFKPDFSSETLTPPYAVMRGSGVRVTNVCPGSVRTNIARNAMIGRVGTRRGESDANIESGLDASDALD